MRMMKRNRSFWLALIAVAAALLPVSGCAQDTGVKFVNSLLCDPNSLEAAHIAASTTSERPTGQVYHLEPVKAYPAYVEQIARGIGLSAPVTERSNETGQPEFVVDDPVGRLTFDERTGELVFQSFTAVTGSGRAMLSEQAKFRAEELLTSLDLTPQMAFTAHVRSSDNSDQSDVIFVADKMHMARSGDGQMIEMGLNSGGDLLYMTYSWREPDSNETYRLISSKEAQHRVEKCEGDVSGVYADSSGFRSPDLTEVDIRHIPSSTTSGDFLVPAYVFHSNFEFADWWVDWVVVLALPDANLTTPTPFPSFSP
jgi:hypothetical protein